MSERETTERRHTYMLMARGVETPCEKCGGTGSYTYGDTSTWRGGVGGQTMTTDVCDRCWGSGDEHRRWTNLRSLSSRSQAGTTLASDKSAIVRLLTRRCTNCYTELPGYNTRGPGWHWVTENVGPFCVACWAEILPELKVRP